MLHMESLESLPDLSCSQKMFVTRFARRTTSTLLSSTRTFATLPPHEVLPMPALSPTMEMGGISRWSIQEGDSISAGDILLEVETDKATVDYEAQDDAFLAKILLPDASSDIAVGTPICVLVEEEADIAAFADYVPEENVSAVPLEMEVSTEVTSTSTPTSAPTPTPSPSPSPTPVATALPKVSAPAPAGAVDSTLSSDRVLYGDGVRRSALSTHLLQEQEKYNTLYGTTLLESKGTSQEQ